MSDSKSTSAASQAVASASGQVSEPRPKVRLTPPRTCAKMPRLAVQSDLAARYMPLSARKPSPFRGRWLLATIGVALLCALFLTLGIWQLQRLEQKRAANALILARMQEPPLTLSGQPLDPEQANLRRATVRGTYDYSQEIVLRNRTLNEIPGVHVIVPLRIAGSDAAVLVDRGWIPYEMADPEQRTEFRQAAGRGRSQRHPPPQPGARAASRARRPAARPRPAAAGRLAPRRPPAHPGADPLSAVAALPGGRSGARRTRPALPRAAPEIALSEGGHLGYAVQWFAFAGILLGGYALFFHQRAQRT